ncbi:hypothetical protein ACFV9C_42520 [Kribbella sp. NPDC059898]|uniref:hypothetical protein n=1 Tax=Kribbella sp. NPDC059898 TaxID=3346995 RepID=UPI00365ABF54
MSTLTDAVASKTGAEYRLTHSLNSEWRLLCTSPDAHRELAQWRQTEPALSSAETLEDLVSLVADNPNPTHAALIRRAQNGSTLAGRCVIQLMLPKIARIARSQVRATVDFDEAAAAVVAAMWAQIMKFALANNPPSIAGRLALDSLKAVTRAADHDHFEFSHSNVVISYSDPENFHSVDTLESVQVRNSLDRNAGIEVLEVLSRATQRKVITTDEARLLAEVYLKSDHRSSEAVARELNISSALLRQRCSRITRRLRAHAELLAA